MTRTRSIAVALHDVSPETFLECRQIRDWLYARGIDRATLLAVPASGGEPFYTRCPELATWLKQQAAAGDAIAQHGYEHHQRTRARPLVQWRARRQGAGSAEFAGLDEHETASAVARGRRILEQVGIDVRGFVAPAYFYTPTLRRELAAAFDWWAGLVALYAPRDPGRRPRGGSHQRPVLAPRRCQSASSRRRS